MIRFRDEGSGPAVVLLHGWPVTALHWRRTAPALLAAGLRVVTVTLPGLGEPGPPEAGTVHRPVETAGTTVRGTLSVRGPFEAPGDETRMGTRTVLDDTVDGRDARLFVVSHDFHRWLWQDDEGRSWLAEIDGYPLEEARALLAGVGTAGDQVTWDAAAAPGARVAHQRTGPPYGVEPPVAVWNIGVSPTAPRR